MTDAEQRIEDIDRWATLIISGERDPLPAAVRAWTADSLFHWPPGPAAQATLVIEELVREARAHGTAPHVLRLATGTDHTKLYVVLDDRTPEGATPWPTPSSWTLLNAFSSGVLAEQYAGARAVCLELTFDEPVPEVLRVAQPLPLPRSSDR